MNNKLSEGVFVLFCFLLFFFFYKNIIAESAKLERKGWEEWKDPSTGTGGFHVLMAVEEIVNF